MGAMSQVAYIPPLPPLPSLSPLLLSALIPSFHWHIIKSVGLGAQVAEGYESLPGTGRMRNKSPGGGGLELLSPLTPGLIQGDPITRPSNYPVLPA